MKRISTLFIIIISIAFDITISGCSMYTEEAKFTIYNDTDNAIVVYYNDDEDPDNNLRQQLSINPNDSGIIQVHGEYVTSVQIRVFYCGLVKSFTIKANTFGEGSIHIKTSDFKNSSAPSGLPQNQDQNELLRME